MHHGAGGLPCIGTVGARGLHRILAPAVQCVYKCCMPCLFSYLLLYLINRYLALNDAFLLPFSRRTVIWPRSFLLYAKDRRRALQSRYRAALRSQRSVFESARPRARRILDDLRGTGARSSALPHTPTCRELYCRRIVGSVMVRIGFERNEPWLKKVFTIAFLSLVDGLEPIHSRRERRAR